MTEQKMVFLNKELNLNLAGILRLPAEFDLGKKYPAVVITGPMLSIKEQAQSVYATRLTEAGYVTLVFDGSYFGESEGMPRFQELPDAKESDIEAAVDYLSNLPYVDANHIGGLGICGSGSYMSVAGVKEPRLKAVTAAVRREIGGKGAATIVLMQCLIAYLVAGITYVIANAII